MNPADLLARASLPRHEAVRLLAAAAGLRPVDVVVGGDLDDAAARRFEEFVARRRDGEPLQHIEGTVDFGPIELLTDRRALVPRPETEELWELAVAAVADAPPDVIVDLCTGSGNLALALKAVYTEARVIAADRSSDALALAAENAARTGLHIQIVEGDLFDPLPPEIRGTVGLLVANPPYLSDEEFASAPVEVRDHDPREALVAGPHGDEVLARIASGVGTWLAPGGTVIVEIGWTQGRRARELFAHLGGEVRRDMSSRDRFVIGRAGDS